MTERKIVQDPSLICFVNELMTLAKEGYELDPEMYPNTFGGLYHTVVLKPSALKANEGVIQLTQEQANKLEETFAEIVPPDNTQSAAKRGPKPKGK